MNNIDADLFFTLSVTVSVWNPDDSPWMVSHDVPASKFSSSASVLLGHCAFAPSNNYLGMHIATSQNSWHVCRSCPWHTCSMSGGYMGWHTSQWMLCCSWTSGHWSLQFMAKSGILLMPNTPVCSSPVHLRMPFKTLMIRVTRLVSDHFVLSKVFPPCFGVKQSCKRAARSCLADWWLVWVVDLKRSWISHLRLTVLVSVLFTNNTVVGMQCSVPHWTVLASRPSLHWVSSNQTLTLFLNTFHPWGTALCAGPMCITAAPHTICSTTSLTPCRPSFNQLMTVPSAKSIWRYPSDTNFCHDAQWCLLFLFFLVSTASTSYCPCSKCLCKISPLKPCTFISIYPNCAASMGLHKHLLVNLGQNP